MGSSPLTRGKRRRNRIRGLDPGLIPAHAGKTMSSAPARVLSRAHPRSRGENQRPPRHEVSRRGSSPLTRGKLRAVRGARGGCGLIPAHAGKTCPARRGAPRLRAHPRSRGENVGPGGAEPQRVRLIPAHAGKTSQHPTARYPHRAHPRSRGENADGGSSRRRPAGSSPLTRGKPRIARIAGLPGGLIPAHAGKTCTCRPCHRTRQAHPRSRGENGGWDTPIADWRGSSPLTRGKLDEAARLARRGGLIPAHAGKTPRRSRRAGP